MIRAMPVGVFLGLVIAGGAFAQEVISTAPDGQSRSPPAAPVAANPLQIQRPDPFPDGPLPLLGPCGGVVGSTDGRPVKPDKNVHGQVWAGVGTSGYREIGGAACAPIGDHGAVSIAVDRGQINGPTYQRRQ
jgi:hypothetical protein